MVKIRLISDIHFDAGLNGLEEHSTKDPNHSPFGSYFGKELKNEKADVTIIAGDLSATLNGHDLFLNTFFNNQNVIFIGGNHEVYRETGQTIYEIKEEMRQAFPETHLFWHYLENDWMWLPGANRSVAVIGSTFYTDYEYTNFTVDSYNEYKKAWNDALKLWGLGNYTYKPVKRLTKKMIIAENKLLASENLNDFRWGLETHITNITPETYLKLNRQAKDEVIRCHKEIVECNPEAKIILVTHHCLSTQCIDTSYVRDKSNASYVSDLEKWICKELPNVRLVNSGHVHCRKDFTFGKDKKRYIVNACGYIRRREPWLNDKFKPNLIINTEEL